MKTRLFISSLILSFFTLGTLSAQDSDFHLDEVYNLSNSGTVHLNSSDANVKITGSSRSDVHVVIDRTEVSRGISSRRGKFDVTVEERSGDLYITERQSRGATFRMGYHRVDYDIEIEMPSNGSLRIKGDDDDYVIRSVNGAISIKADDGDIELIECNGDDFDLEFEDGDLKMDGGKGSLYVRCDDGDLDVRNGGFESIEIAAEDGNVSIETSLSDKGVYELRGDDADIDFVVLKGGGKFFVSKDDGRITASSAFDKIEETERRARLELSGGAADVDIRINDGRVRLSTGR